VAGGACGSAPGARGLYAYHTYPLTGEAPNQVSYFETSATTHPRTCRGMADAGRRLRPRGQACAPFAAWSSAAGTSRTGVCLGQRLEHHYSFAAHPDPSLGRSPRPTIHRLSRAPHQEIGSRADCATANPVLLRRGNGECSTPCLGRLIAACCAAHHEMMTYRPQNPDESRERTDEGMDLILRPGRNAPFAAGRDAFPFRNSVGLARPLQQPLHADVCPRTSSEASELRRPANISASACRSARST